MICWVSLELIVFFVLVINIFFLEMKLCMVFWFSVFWVCLRRLWIFMGWILMGMLLFICKFVRCGVCVSGIFKCLYLLNKWCVIFFFILLVMIIFLGFFFWWCRVVIMVVILEMWFKICNCWSLVFKWCLFKFIIFKMWYGNCWVLRWEVLCMKWLIFLVGLMSKMEVVFWKGVLCRCLKDWSGKNRFFVVIVWKSMCEKIINFIVIGYWMRIVLWGIKLRWLMMNISGIKISVVNVIVLRMVLRFWNDV